MGLVSGTWPDSPCLFTPDHRLEISHAAMSRSSGSDASDLANDFLPDQRVPRGGVTLESKVALGDRIAKPRVD
jgi:hypothetical protein